MTDLIITREYMKNASARAIPGARWSAEDKAWVIDIDAAPEYARRVLVKLFPEHFETVPLEPDLDIRPIDLATEWAGECTTDQLLQPTVGPVRDLLHRYQAVDLAFLCARLRSDGAAYNGWDRGLGKTLGALVIARELGLDKVVIVAPNSAKDLVWRPEIEQWYSDVWDADHVYDFGGPQKKREKQLRWWQAAERGVLLTHYEALRLLPEDTAWPPYFMIVVDEAHRLSNGGNTRQKKVPLFYRALQNIPATYRLAMSGSIINNTPEDLFGALHWLMPTRYRARWKDYNDRFLQYVESEHGQVLVGVKPEALDAMRHELAGFLVVRSKDDELDLPEKICQTLRVTLSPGQRKAYDELAKQLWTVLEDGEHIRLDSHIAKLTKLRQVASGLDAISDTIEDSSKLDAAVDLVRDNPGKVVCFTWHRAVADALQKRLEAIGVGCAKVHGGVAMKDRAEQVLAFQTDPEVHCLVATLRTLGESVNLQQASDVIFLESSWVPTDMQQAEDRVHRQGQKIRVSVTTIVARDTVDETQVLPTMLTKAALKRMLFGN